MAKKDYATEILEQMENGTAEILSKYEKLLAASGSRYDSMLAELDAPYHAAAGQASAKKQIALSNTLEMLADKGLSKSGVSQQSELVANAGLMNSLATLSAQKAKDAAEIVRQKESSVLELEREKSEETANFRNKIYQEYLDQANADRDFELQSEKNNLDNQLKAQTLALEKQKLATEQAKKELITPSENPYDYFAAIVERNTKIDKEKGMKITYKTKIEDALRTIIYNQNVSEAYRYELYLYAKAMGYL